jgi:hypothetical protein
MADMERDMTTFVGTDAATARIGQLRARRNGKTAAQTSDRAWVDETAPIGMWPARKRQLTNHQRGRKAAAPVRDRPRRGPVACPHREVIWLERPHPRYGKAQPYFVPRVVAAEEHDCFVAAG